MEQRTIVISLLMIFAIAGGALWLVSPEKVPQGDPYDAHVIGANEPIHINESTETNDLPANTKIVKANIETTKGTYVLELYPDIVPTTAGNFITLAESGFYNGIKIHRVEPNFVVQFGDPQTKTLPLTDPRIGSGGPGYTIPDEFAPEMKNDRGTISMANAGAHTGGSQVFINFQNNNFLDNKHAVFGRVVSGMDIVESLTVGDTITEIRIEK